MSQIEEDASNDEIEYMSIDTITDAKNSTDRNYDTDWDSPTDQQPTLTLSQLRDSIPKQRIRKTVDIIFNVMFRILLYMVIISVWLLMVDVGVAEAVKLVINGIQEPIEIIINDMTAGL